VFPAYRSAWIEQIVTVFRNTSRCHRGITCQLARSSLTIGVVQNPRFSGHTGVRKPRPARAGFQFARFSCGEAASLPGLGLPMLKRLETRQGEPVRMGLTRHQFSRTFCSGVWATTA
jgi:hypothetical protein